jgi:hypothetical protein
MTVAAPGPGPDGAPLQVMPREPADAMPLAKLRRIAQHHYGVGLQPYADGLNVEWLFDDYEFIKHNVAAWDF